MDNQIKNFIEETEEKFEELWGGWDGAPEGTTKGLDYYTKEFICSRQISLIKMIVEEGDRLKYTFKKVDWGDGIITDENVEDETICLAEAQGFNRALDTISSKLKELTDGK
jgi:hypothetical protein